MLSSVGSQMSPPKKNRSGRGTDALQPLGSNVRCIAPIGIADLCRCGKDGMGRTGLWDYIPVLGCPRKLVKGYSSKWVIPPIYPSYNPFTNFPDIEVGHPPFSLKGEYQFQMGSSGVELSWGRALYFNLIPRPESAMYFPVKQVFTRSWYSQIMSIILQRSMISMLLRG